MRELNPIGREQDSLLLISEDGEQFSVTVDDALMKTLKEHRVPDQSGVELTPREIQDAVRSGESITSIAERSGGRLSLIERFAHPVLEELQHMVELAQAVRVELPADRFNDVLKKNFGDIVEEKLIDAGADEIVWSAKRGENFIWEISVRYQQNGNTVAATWTFDPRKYLLTPETSNAAALSNPTSTIDSPLGARNKHVLPEVSSESTVVTADKLQAFRKRREQIAVEPEPVVIEPVSIEIIEDFDPEIGEESQALPTEPLVIVEVTEPEVETNSHSKKTRAPMPSWDQIVRGTQADDDEAF